jgi:preprotein translocase subunit SecA
VGTTSVEKSEILSTMLKRRGVAHEVLNAKYHEREAAIVAMAGHKGAVTVATNMAGRGTDIMLGGNPDFIADLELHQRELSPLETPEAYETAWPAAVAKAKQAVAQEHEEVVAAGGLYVLGTERHESRRIDNQLRGRSGRQGDPGETRFYLSLEDDLMRMFNSDRVGAIMDRLNIPADVPVESKVVTRAIRSAQTQVEQQNFEIRKDVLKYDDVLNRQRKVVYDERHQVLEGADLKDQILRMTDEVIESYTAGATSEGFPEEWDLDKLWKAFRQLFPITITVDDMIEEAGDKAGLTADLITEVVTENAHDAYERREEELTPDVMRVFERQVVLSVLDRKWREHLYEMDYLREGIGLRAMAQRDPLVEYQREGFDMFNAMMDGIKEESVGALFNLKVEVQQNPITEEAGETGVAAPGTAPELGVAPAAGPAPGSAPGVPSAPATETPGAATAASGAGPAGAGPAAPGPAPQTGGNGASGRSGAGASRAANKTTAGARATASKTAAGAKTPAGTGRAAGTGRTPAGTGRAAGTGKTPAGTGKAAGTGKTTAGAGRTTAGTGGRHRGDPKNAEAEGNGNGATPVLPAGLGPRRSGALQYTAPSVDGGTHVESHVEGTPTGGFANVGRNDPCPCGSGRKYKRCHGDPRNRVAD